MDQTVNVTAKSENTFSGGDVPIAVEIIVKCIYFMPWLLFLYIVVGFPLFCCFACFYKCCCPKQSYPQPVRVQPDLRSQTNAINGAAAAATATNIQKTIDQNWCNFFCKNTCLYRWGGKFVFFVLQHSIFGPSGSFSDHWVSLMISRSSQQ